MSDGLFTTGGGTSERSRRVVNVADYAVATDGETLVAYGLGSCVGIGLVDPEHGAAALAHAMLPSEDGNSAAPRGKFVDTAVEEMLREMVEAGASYGRVEGWLVGGAQIFSLADLGLPREVGQRTVDAARNELRGLGIPIVADATGGSDGRTVEFDTATGRVVIDRAEGESEQLYGGTA